jgi:hypothetical protein
MKFLSSMTRGKITAISGWTGFFILLWVTLILLQADVTLGFNRTISIWNIILPALLGFVLAFLLLRKSPREKANEIVISLALAFFSILIPILWNSLVFDNSYDGQDYQQYAVIRLIHGFNFFYQTAQPENSPVIAALNHYPDGPWIVAAAITKLTGNLESGKALNLISILASFWICLAFCLFLDRLNFWQALLLAGIAAFNPVSIYQSLSFYVDGLVSTYILITLASGMLLLRNPNRRDFFTFVFALIIGLNIKFTGTIYIILISSALAILSLFMYRRHWSRNKVFFALVVGGIFGIGWAGFHPYFTNLYRHGNPFYPVIGGKDGFDQNIIMKSQSPYDFEGQTQLTKLYRSIFSESENAYGDMSSSRKLPFSIRLNEIKAFNATDVRVGGLGPWFSGILIISCFLLAALILANSKLGLVALGLVGVLTASILINPECWWARYSPQLWFIPCVILLGVFLSTDRKVRYAGWALALPMILNILMVTAPYYWYNVRESADLRNELSRMANSGDSYLVYLGRLSPWSVKLDRFKVNYQIVSSVDQLPCPTRLQLIYYSTQDCSK